MTTLPTIEFALSLAYDAGKLIEENFFVREKETNFKVSSADLVTKTDLAVEEMLIRKIKEKHPTHLFLCEESTDHHQELTDTPTWVIDPVDGTMNFVHTLPFIAVSIGFCVNKKIELGVVYNPIMKELFYATRNGGSWLISGNPTNPPQKLFVAPHRILAHSVVGTGFSVGRIRKLMEEEERNKMSEDDIRKSEEIRDISFHNSQQLMLNSRDLRRLGSCAMDMAFVASGRLDAMAEIGVHEWDVCAGVLLIEEAGGAVINYDKSHPADLSKCQIIGASSMELALSLANILRHPSFDIRLLK